MNQANLIDLSAKTLGKDLLQAMVDELQQTEWANKPTLDQEQTISRLRTKCTELIGQGLTLMFSGAHPACIATIDSVTVKKGLKVGLKIAKGAANWPSVVDAEGQNVLIVMADAEDYRASMDEVKTRAAQSDLFSGEYKGTQEFRRDEADRVLPEKTWADVTGTPIEEMAIVDVNQWTCDALASADVHVAIEKIEGWSERECAVALEWALAEVAWREKENNPEPEPVRPWFLPMPDPSINAAKKAADEAPRAYAEATA